MIPYGPCFVFSQNMRPYGPRMVKTGSIQQPCLHEPVLCWNDLILCPVSNYVEELGLHVQKNDNPRIQLDMVAKGCSAVFLHR